MAPSQSQTGSEQLLGRVPREKVANPLADVDPLTPLTTNQIAEYNSWMSTLVEFDLDSEDAHSICAHCRVGDLGIVQARDEFLKVFAKEHLMTEDHMHPSLMR